MKNDREIDQILTGAAQIPHDVNPAVLDHVLGSLAGSMSPVRPLPSPGVLTVGLIAISAGLALIGARLTGFRGIERMTGGEREWIFPALAVLLWLAAAALVSQAIPGSRVRLSPGVLLALSSVVLLAIFGALFRDYHTDRFVYHGVICLLVGEAIAMPTALGSWWLLRRGFAVNPGAAGLVAGTLAGLAGVTMLELHCPIFEAWHVIVWHTAVVLVSAAAGAMASRASS